MKAAYAPVLLVIMLSAQGLCPVLAQLPPTNMGKFVHQPGDNQYSDATQQQRHGAPVQAAQPQFRQAPSVPAGYNRAPAPRKPDITLEPISAAEPIPQAGFPPMPDRLDLPVASSGGNSWNASRGYSGGGGAAPGMSSGGTPAATFHQHYGHVPPGAYLKNQGGGGQGYYKARSPGSDDYNAGGTPGLNSPNSAERQLRNLGREPRLNGEQAVAPEAPTPVVVSQSTTQDLSLPDDDFTVRQLDRKSGAGKALGRAIKRPLNSFGGLAGVRF